ILASVINASSSSDARGNWKKLAEEMIKSAQQDADKLLTEMKKEQGKVEITYQSILGFPMEEAIDEFAIENKVELIIMGTKGATGLKKVTIGSNATAVIDNSSVPVIVVPGENKFKTIKNIVYATDYKNLATELKTMVRFATFFNAPLHVLHVVGSSTKKEMEELEQKMARNTSSYSKISFHVVKSANISGALDKFTKDNKADLLALFTHKLDFYEKLFGKSVTRQLAFHSTVPILTFNKTNIDI
ncbi:MAG TPA: universal stress protein, partial [Cyclobacteriaceae bacterium]|nr:universal stress protein [Cyclobacteriaceae bacterium]